MKKIVLILLAISLTIGLMAQNQYNGKSLHKIKKDLRRKGFSCKERCGGDANLYFFNTQDSTKNVIVICVKEKKQFKIDALNEAKQNYKIALENLDKCLVDSQLNLFSNEVETPVCVLPRVTSSAFISECGQYRYELRRTWDESRPKVMFLMLNPSTADADIDDPTIRRCVAFAKSWNYGGILVGNLFAYRATEPKTLLTVTDPIGNENLTHLKVLSFESDIIVCAWGNSKIVEKLGRKLGEDYKPLSVILGRLFYLELANDGTPKHPLYLKGDLKPVRFEVPACRVS